MKNIKLYLILGVITLVVGLCTYYAKTYSLVKTKAYNQKTDSLKTLKYEVDTLDSLAWSLQQEIDINDKNKASREMVISALSAENRRLRNAENTCCEELKHAEETGGIIRDTIRLNIWGKIKRKK